MSIGEPRYPGIILPLSDCDGNAFAVLGRARKAFRRNKIEDSVWEEFRAEATAGDYEHLLLTCFRWFDVD